MILSLVDRLKSDKIMSRLESTRSFEQFIKYEFALRDDQIDKDSARSILIRSFIGEYKKYLLPEEIDSQLKYCWIKEGLDSFKLKIFPATALINYFMVIVSNIL